MLKNILNALSSILAKEQVLALTVALIASIVAVRSCVVSERSAELTAYDKQWLESKYAFN
jgi:hypothetical protein